MADPVCVIENAALFMVCVMETTVFIMEDAFSGLSAVQGSSRTCTVQGHCQNQKIGSGGIGLDGAGWWAGKFPRAVAHGCISRLGLHDYGKLVFF